jgi:predicted MPP superfamily phosphohydrolase
MQPVLSRRRFLACSAAAVGGLGLYTWQVEPHWLDIVRRPLPIAGLPTALVGRTLAQLSDIHVGPNVADWYLARTFARVRAIEPDIIVYTGDFTTLSNDVFAHAQRIYADAPHGRMATLGVLGNHDYGRRWHDPAYATRTVEVLSNVGIRILRNELTDVAGLSIVGMDELQAGRFDPATALATLQPDRPALALAHNPDTVDLPGWDRYAGWILAGHTHGGQCKPPFLPPPLLPVRNRRYVAGPYDLSSGRQLYVNRGVGHNEQVRFNVRPEVTLFELVQTPRP